MFLHVSRDGKFLCKIFHELLKKYSGCGCVEFAVGGNIFFRLYDLKLAQVIKNLACIFLNPEV